MWNEILTPAQVDAANALTATLDPAFALTEREFWETRTTAQLKALRDGAWAANDSTTYQMARSYLSFWS